MEERDLEAIRKRRYLEMKKVFEERTKKRSDEKSETKKETSYDTLNRIFVGRAWEVFSAARIQYPEAARQVGKALVQMAKKGKNNKKIGGGELYSLFRHLGIRIRLNTKIRFLRNGKMKSLGETLKGES